MYDKGPSPYKSVGTAFRTIVREEGARALYQVWHVSSLTLRGAQVDVVIKSRVVHTPECGIEIESDSERAEDTDRPCVNIYIIIIYI